jgi:hypothetical protein
MSVQQLLGMQQGAGKRLFAEGAELPLELVDTRRAGDTAILTLTRKA